jgi:hypothetical protein
MIADPLLHGYKPYIQSKHRMRPKTGPRNSYNAVQAERLASVDRELGCDEDKAAFKATPAVIGRQKPIDEQKEKSSARRRNT